MVCKSNTELIQEYGPDWQSLPGVIINGGPFAHLVECEQYCTPTPTQTPSSTPAPTPSSTPDPTPSATPQVTPPARQISGLLSTAQQIAGSTGIITPYNKQFSSPVCACGGGGTIYYIITWN